MDLPEDIRVQIGPWGTLFASGFLLVASAAAASIWWLARKTYNGCCLVYALMETMAMKHLKFVDTVGENIVNMRDSMDRIATDMEKVKTSVGHVEDKVNEWPSDWANNKAKK